MKTGILTLVIGTAVAIGGFVFGSLVGSSAAVEAGEADIVSRANVAMAYDCPNGEPLSEYTAGSRVFAVARSDGGAWIQVRDLDAPGLRLWIPSVALSGDASLDALPLASCDGSGTTESAPSTTTTTPATTTTTSTTVPVTTTSSSTTAPDTTPPKLGVPDRDESKIWELDDEVITCPPQYPRESIITVTAEDAESGIDRVRATWVINGEDGAMNLAGSGTYTGTFGPFGYPTVPESGDEIVTITVTARDGAGNETSDTVDVRVHSLAGCFG